jgi:transglutaminase-like putative cysteine protease
MFYSIRHLTQFRYDSPVSESLMEVRMHPRTEGGQRCLSFQLSVEPRAHVNMYRDYHGNSIHHFDVPGKHKELNILAEALVETTAPPEPPERLDPGAWEQLDAEAAAGDYWEMLMPSHFARPSEALDWLIGELRVERRADPLTFLRELNAAIYAWFEYVPKATSVDSPIEHAIESRKGVCQDFAHIMTSLARHVRIPCRYVSGYVLPRPKNADRQARTSRTGATHAWVEAMVPGPSLGEGRWVGFDPTNNLLAGERHIRAAIGRDYADVPPTKGIFKGCAQSELAVTVRVTRSEAPPPPERELRSAAEWIAANAPPEALPEENIYAQQQQQQ